MSIAPPARQGLPWMDLASMALMGQRAQPA
jgi:hypothetical protein